MATPRNILIFHPAGIGDAILAFPAIKALRATCPDSWITLVTSRRAWAIVEGCPYVDEILGIGIEEMPIKLFNRISVSDLWHLWRRLRRRPCDLVVDFTRIGSRLGGVKRAIMFAAIGAGHKIGRNTHGRGFYLDDSPDDPPTTAKHEVESCLEIVALAGASSAEPQLEIFLTDADHREAAGLLDTIELKPTVIGFNPNANWPAKKWPRDRVVAAADTLAERHDATIVLIGSPQDRADTAEIAQRMSQPAADIAGRLSLKGTGALLSRLDVFVTNDTGPMHMAAAVKTPTVAIFGPIDPDRYGPYGLGEQCRILSRWNLCAAGCEIVCARPTHRCMEDIQVADVVTAADELLAHKTRPTGNHD
ncbi:MAG: glycosyltransferase family 9 protein [Lentisphaeria bacterium]|jgi:lipopolysaccharide heptosyltransferase II|nr:glycosyltransferase family 9 protein [Lentisphaeria bacterium]MDP7743465.1 glycosyltransferase family 9 protein [Lentisphaeria bacterium]